MRILGVIGLVALTSTAAAQERGLLARDCRHEIVGLCGLDRNVRRACIIDNQDKLSAECRDELRTLAGAAVEVDGPGPKPEHRLGLEVETGSALAIGRVHRARFCEMMLRGER